jgi:hypothetical protein
MALGAGLQLRGALCCCCVLSLATLPCAVVSSRSTITCSAQCTDLCSRAGVHATLNCG